jgi:ribosomal-protein-alanine N-acetyltransferase
VNEAPSTRLREGNLADLDTIMTIMVDSFDPAFGEAWTAPQCSGLLPMPGVWISLAYVEEEPAGFALGRIVLREAELLLLAVRKEMRRRGTGGLLIERFVEIARTRGAEKVHLEVRDGNMAMKLYEREGFSLIGRRKHYYTGRDGQLSDALTLARTL